MNKKKVSILGLGWLGQPLAHELMLLGYDVNGSTTSELKRVNMRKEGLQSYFVKLTEEGVQGKIQDLFLNTDILVLNIPPGLRRNPNASYVSKIKSLIPFIESSSISRVLLVSSTSVFKAEVNFPEIKNSTLPNGTSEAAKQLIEVEDLLFNNSNFKTTILRFAGLIDERRHPATMMSKRKGIKGGGGPVNLIHLKDCIQIITTIIEKGIWNEKMNAAYSNHPTKKEYYKRVCENMNLPMPEFLDEIDEKGKKINGLDTIRLLGINYLQPII